MNRHPPLLATFQSLLALSEQMADLACAQEWDQLVQLEGERARLSAQLPAQLPDLPRAEAQSIAELIKRILECNASIQGHVTPWMEHVSVLLAAFSPKAQPRAE